MRYLILILFASSLQAQSPLHRVEWNPDEVAGAENLLLDDYPGAAAAYSLRQLRDGVINVIRVRKDDTNAEADFSAEQIIDGTLAAFVGAGNNGYVVTWYDQSGNNYHATETTAASQPKIYDASTGLVMENGKPAVLFAENDDDLITLTNSNIIINQPYTIFVKANRHDFSERQTLLAEIDFENSSTSWRLGVYVTDTNILWMNAGVNLDYGSVIVGDQLHYGFFNGANSKGALNGGFATLGDAGNNAISDLKIGGAGSRIGQFGYGWIGTISEIIIYPNDQSSNREGIETDINSHYNIY